MDVKEAIRPQSSVAKRDAPDFTEQLIEPFIQLRNEVDRLFESFPLRLPSLKLDRFVAVPVLETTETDKTYKVTAEIPGIDPKDVEVTFEDGLLRIAGEKKEERDENERGFSLSERSYGAFERLIALPGTVNPDKINARFKNGVLTISIAKDGKKKTPVRRIDIKYSA